MIIRTLVRLCLLSLAFLLAADGWSEPFAFGEVVLSRSSSFATTNYYYDAQAGAYFATRVNRPSGEPYLRHELTFLKGRLDDPQRFSRTLTIFATEHNEPYFMQFEGSSDYRMPPPARNKLETLRDCEKSAEPLGGIVRSASASGVTGLTVFIVLDPYMPVDAQTESLAMIDRWTAGASARRGSPDRVGFSPYDFESQLDFKTFAEILGPRFRGAVISCSASDVGINIGWQTRFIDLNLASTVFNIYP